MKMIRVVAVYAVVMGLALLSGQEADAGGGCLMTVHVMNGFKVPIKVTKAELGSAVSGYVTKWEGEKSIEPGKKITRSFRTGTPCTDKAGNPKKWDVRIHRKNGVKHSCGGLSTESTLKLVKGGGCSVRDDS